MHAEARGCQSYEDITVVAGWSVTGKEAGVTDRRIKGRDGQESQRERRTQTNSVRHEARIR